MEFLEHWGQLEIAMENFKFKKDQSRPHFPGEGRPPSPSKSSGRGRQVDEQLDGKLDVEAVGDCHGKLHFQARPVKTAVTR